MYDFLPNKLGIVLTSRELYSYYTGNILICQGFFKMIGNIVYKMFKAIKHFIQEKHDIERKDLMINPFIKFHKMGMFQGSLMNELVEIIDDRREA